MFNLVDALSSEAAASSFLEWSFTPFFERTWASLYKALEDGRIVGDRWYACAPFLTCLVDVEACRLLRVKSNHVFSRPAPARLAGQLGARGIDGERFQCQDESSPGEPDETWESLDDKGARIQVRCWNHLHLRPARWVEGSVIQVIRHGASEKARDRHPAVGFSGKGIARLRWPRSAQRIGCAPPMSMAIALTNRSCSGMCPD